MDKILNPLVCKLKTFLKDEYYFLQKFPKKISPGSEIFCCDVTSLYTGIPMELGVEALDYWLTKLATMIDNRFSKQFILECVQFILVNNYFQFAGMM